MSSDSDLNSDSGAGWSERDIESCRDGGTDNKLHAFRESENQRYEFVGELDSGGMGDVRVVFDRRLGREVAQKRISIRIDSPETRERLQREAWITARLEHPSIISVHDAGEDSGGRLFYTMRLLRGEPLNRALGSVESDSDMSSTGDSPEQGAHGQSLVFLRHYLDVCNALAFAHSQGIVHRDIKPANIVVGEFGETQVIDWGLASTVDATTSSAMVGTPGFASPERSKGCRPLPSSDVWSLGAVLKTILVSCEDSSEDLAAIADKAMDSCPDKRYANAGTLAADVERYLDGRRVAARQYSSWELLRRLVRVWRIPLIIAGVAAVAMMVVLVYSVDQIRGERSKAVAAEASTAEALSATNTMLANNLEEQSLALQASGALPDAERMAVLALAIRESPNARGVLANSYSKTRLEFVGQQAMPACVLESPTSTMRSVGKYVVCSGDGVVSLWDISTMTQRWSVRVASSRAEIAGQVVAVSRSSGKLSLYALQTGSVVASFSPSGGRHPGVASPDGTLVASSNGAKLDVVDTANAVRRYRFEPCPDGSIDAIAISDTRVVAVCNSGELVVYHPVSGEVLLRVEIPFGRHLRPAIAVAVSPLGDTIAIGGIGGEVVRVDVHSKVVGEPVRGSTHAITELVFLRNLLIVSSEQGGASIWDMTSGTEVLRLPMAKQQTITVEKGRLIFSGPHFRRMWEVPDTLVRTVFHCPEGVASASLSSDGHYLAAARGDGYVSVWSRITGELDASLELSTGVVKSVAFSSDSEILAAGVSDKEIPSRLYSVADWSSIDHKRPPMGVKRMAFRANGTLLGALYKDSVMKWHVGKTGALLSLPPIRDLNVSHDDRALLLSEDGIVFEMDDENRPSELFVASGGVAIDAISGTEDIVVAHDNGVRIHSTSGSRFLPSLSGHLLDIAVSADGKYVVAASKVGTIDVWSLESDQLVAILRGHTERVSHVRFGIDGTLASSSWDGTVRLWNLAPLEDSPKILRQRFEATWGAP